MQGDVEREAETGGVSVSRVTAEIASYQSQERGLQEIFPPALRRNHWASCLQKGLRCLSEPLSLWFLVTADLGNYTGD